MSAKRFIAALFITVAALLMVFLGWNAAQLLFGNNLGADLSGALDQVTEKQINVLCMGLDDGKTRADTIMLVSIVPKEGKINILSIPRDTRVQVNGKYIKINATMGYKRREELMIQKVKEITGLPVHYYAEVDFDGFIEVINILGGIDYDVPYNMNYDDPVQGLHIHLNKGMQHLDGQAAHDFVRFRHNNDWSAPGEYAMGDYGRIKAQQNFLKELFRQKLQPQYITKAPELIQALYTYVKTNMSVADAISYASGVLKSFNGDSIQTYQIAGEPKMIDNLSYFVYDPVKTDALVDEVFLGKGSATASPSAAA